MFDTDTRRELRDSPSDTAPSDSAPSDSAPSDTWWPEGITGEPPNSDIALVSAGLDDMEPGAEPAAVLAVIDVECLSGYDMVTVLRAHQRMVYKQMLSCIEP